MFFFSIIWRRESLLYNASPDTTTTFNVYIYREKQNKKRWGKDSTPSPKMVIKARRRTATATTTTIQQQKRQRGEREKIMAHLREKRRWIMKMKGRVTRQMTIAQEWIGRSKYQRQAIHNKLIAAPRERERKRRASVATTDPFTVRPAAQDEARPDLLL